MNNPKLVGVRGASARLDFVLVFFFANLVYANDSLTCEKNNCGELAAKHLEQGDVFKASELYSRGCELGDRTACYNAATIHADGYLGEQDFLTAKPFYEKACEMQESDSCSDLADEFDHIEDYANARVYYRAACKLDHAYGCQQLAWNLEHDTTPIDLKQATMLNQKACDLGSGWACNNLGYDYMGYDDEVNPHALKDYAKGIKLMTLACDSYGIGSACTSLSYAYEKGHGVEEALDESLRYAVKACEGVNEPSAGGCVRAGYGYNEGEGAAKNLDKSLYYYEQACNGGDSDGCYGAGYHYEYEIRKRTKKTRKKAKYFYALACEMGDQDAC